MTPDDKNRTEEIRKKQPNRWTDESFILSKLDEAHEIVRIVAKIDIDFIPKGDTFRDVVLKARKVLGEE